MPDTLPTSSTCTQRAVLWRIKIRNLDYCRLTAARRRRVSCESCSMLVLGLAYSQNTAGDPCIFRNSKFQNFPSKQQLAKFYNCPIDTTHSARNLGIIFDEHLTFSDQISSLSKSCYSHTRALRCIRPYLDFRTASTIATSIVHSKLDYCNSLAYTSIYQILK